MKLNIKNWNKYLVAKTLLGIFIGITLMKPFHFLISHHAIQLHSEQEGHKSHDSCLICHFCLDTSIEPEYISIDLSPKYLIVEIAKTDNEAIYNFSLERTASRAPPIHFL